MKGRHSPGQRGCRRVNILQKIDLSSPQRDDDWGERGEDVSRKIRETSPSLPCKGLLQF